MVRGGPRGQVVLEGRAGSTARFWQAELGWEDWKGTFALSAPTPVMMCKAAEKEVGGGLETSSSLSINRSAW